NRVPRGAPAPAPVSAPLPLVERAARPPRHANRTRRPRSRPRLLHDTAGALARRPPVAPDRPPRHPYRQHAVRIAPRLLIRGRVQETLRIDQDEVGPQPGHDPPAVTQPEPTRRTRRQPGDRLFDRDDPLPDRKPPEEPRRRPVQPRMRL